MSKPSRYKITEFKDGFTITGGDDRRPTTMRISSNGLAFDITSEYEVINHWDNTIAPAKETAISTYGIPHLHDIVYKLASNLMMGWQTPKGEVKGSIAGVGWDVRSWAKVQTQKALAGRVKEQWLRLKERMNPEVVALQNRMFSVNLKVPDWILEEEAFYRNKFILQDIMNYRGASAVACRVEDMIADYYGYENRPDTPWLLLEDWMGLYSPDRQAYPALRKTLMNLAGNFPPGPLQALRHIKLPEAIKGRQRLLALTVLGQEMGNINEARYARYYPVILRSTEEAFKEMIVYVGNNFDWVTGPRTFKRFRTSLLTLMDYPGEFGPIDIMGLAHRSIEYHTNENVRRQLESRQRAMAGLEPEDKTALPPIPLPDDKFIHFLETVEEVVDEGQTMGHCVGMYAGYAVSGDSYLFHVEYKGTMATVEIDRQGRINQAHGPKNANNKAVSYGRKLLDKWGSTFPDDIGIKHIDLTLPVAAPQDIPF